jgi:hypothetical protein
VTGASNTAIDESTGTTTVGANTVRTNLVASFNQLRNQLDTVTGANFRANCLASGRGGADQLGEVGDLGAG